MVTVYWTLQQQGGGRQKRSKAYADRPTGRAGMWNEIAVFVLRLLGR